jgi:hypothetical protein
MNYYSTGNLEKSCEIPTYKLVNYLKGENMKFKFDTIIVMAISSAAGSNLSVLALELRPMNQHSINAQQKMLLAENKSKSKLKRANSIIKKQIEEQTKTSKMQDAASSADACNKKRRAGAASIKKCI